MTTLGRIVVTVLVAGVLVTVTVIGAHYLKGPESRLPAPWEPEPLENASEEAGPGPNEEPETPRPPGPSELAEVQDELAKPPDPGEGLADEGLSLLEQGRQIEAQARLSQAVRAGIGGAKGKTVREALNRLADEVQFSWRGTPGDPSAKTYTVAPGNTLIGIGQRFLVPYRLLMKMNRLSSTRINAGLHLKVLQGPIHVEIVKSAFELRVWLGRVCLGVYPVGLGADDSTPEGTFTVEKKIKDPPYQPQHRPRSDFRPAGHPENPLGTRWIDIGNHYGIHGTKEADSVGRAVSEGCIRMYNHDVEELYDRVVPGASRVTIRP